MSEAYIDNHHVRYDPAFDAMMTIGASVKASQDRRAYESKQWHRMHDAPPPGYGLDGYPLQELKPFRK